MGGNHAALHNQFMAPFGGSLDALHATMGALMGQMPAIHQYVLAALATRLGLTTAELEASLHTDGKTLATLAKEKKVAPGELKAVMVTTMQKALNDLVQAGTLDPQVAARIRGTIADHAETCLTTNMTGMMGGGMMGGGMMGAGSGVPAG